MPHLLKFGKIFFHRAVHFRGRVPTHWLARLEGVGGQRGHISKGPVHLGVFTFFLSSLRPRRREKRASRLQETPIFTSEGRGVDGPKKGVSEKVLRAGRARPPLGFLWGLLFVVVLLCFCCVFCCCFLFFCFVVVAAAGVVVVFIFGFCSFFVLFILLLLWLVCLCFVGLVVWFQVSEENESKN